MVTKITNPSTKLSSRLLLFGSPQTHLSLTLSASHPSRDPFVLQTCLSLTLITLSATQPHHLHHPPETLFSFSLITLSASYPSSPSRHHASPFFLTLSASHPTNPSSPKSLTLLASHPSSPSRHHACSFLPHPLGLPMSQIPEIPHPLSLPSHKSLISQIPHPLGLPSPKSLISQIPEIPHPLGLPSPKSLTLMASQIPQQPSASNPSPSHQPSAVSLSSLTVSASLSWTSWSSCIEVVAAPVVWVFDTLEIRCLNFLLLLQFLHCCCINLILWFLIFFRPILLPDLS